MAFGKRKSNDPNGDPRLQEGAYVSHNGRLYRNNGQLAAIDYPATNGTQPVEELWKLEDAMSYGHDVHGDLLHEIITVTRNELLSLVAQPNTIGAPLIPAYRLEREAPKPDQPRVEGLEHLDRQLDQHLAHSAVKNGTGKF